MAATCFHIINLNETNWLIQDDWDTLQVSIAKNVPITLNILYFNISLYLKYFCE